MEVGTKVQCARNRNADGTQVNTNAVNCASHLLTIRQDPIFIEVSFNLSNVTHFNIIENLEVTLFQCPQWNIGAKSLNIFRSNTLSGIRTLLKNVQLSPDPSSCGSFTYCIPGISTLPSFLTLQFSQYSTSRLVYYAQTVLYDDPSHKYVSNNQLLCETNFNPSTDRAGQSCNSK